MPDERDRTKLMTVLRETEALQMELKAVHEKKSAVRSQLEGALAKYNAMHGELLAARRYERINPMVA